MLKNQKLFLHLQIMSNIDFTVKYNRRNKLNKLGEAEVMIRAYQKSSGGGKAREKYFGTGLFVSPRNWDEKCTKIRGENAILYNETLRRQLEKLREFTATEEINGRPPTLEMISDFISDKRTDDFLLFAKMEIEKANIKETTRKTKRARLETIKSFKDKISFANVDYKYMRDIERYFYKMGYKTNFVDRLMKDLIQYAGEAVKRGYIDANKNPFKDYKHKTELTVKDYLNETEINTLETVELPKYLQYTRDLYLFSCYTGFSFCDFISLKKSEIEVRGTRIYIKRKRKKSGVMVDVPISALSQGKGVKIIEKYKADDREEIFNYISLQTINKYLIRICKIAGIEKHLTTSTGRITRATTLARKGAADSTIQNTLGHTKLTTTTQYYIKTTRETLAEDLEKLNC